MTGKTVLITGGNDGIGKQTAIGLAKMGAEIVIACRNMEKAEKALSDIRQQSSNPEVYALPIDLASFESIQQCVQQFQANHTKLDVLINNAGIFTSTPQVTQEGYELQFGVNHLGHFLLTHLLLPQLQAAPAPRVVNVSSNGHYFGKLDLDKVRSDRNRYNGWRAYKRSKLANVLFTREFARRYPAILCNAVHPGGVRTQIATKDSNWLAKTVWNTLTLFMISTEKGAETSIYVASSPEISTISGKYFAKKRIQIPSALALDDQLAQQLWAYSETAIQHMQ